MKLSVSAFRGAQSSTHKKLFNPNPSGYLYGPSRASTSTPGATLSPIQIPSNPNQMMVDMTAVRPHDNQGQRDDVDLERGNFDQIPQYEYSIQNQSDCDINTKPATQTINSKNKKHETGSTHSEKHSRTKSNQRWMKLRTTVQLSNAISNPVKSKPPLKREDSFLKRFSTRQVPDKGTMDIGDGDSSSIGDEDSNENSRKRRKKRRHRRRQINTVVNPDENFYFYWLFLVTASVLYNLWTLIIRQSFPELRDISKNVWFFCDKFTDVVFILDIVVQFRTGYLEQGLMVYDSRKLAGHYMKSKSFVFDLLALTPLELLEYKFDVNPLLRFPRFIKLYRVYDYYYMVESRTVYPNLWRVANLIHILLILAHWFGCFYYLLSEAENFRGDWVYPYNTGEYGTLTRKYLGSLYWSTLTLTTIGDLPTPETNAEYVFTIVSYLIGVFIFATIVGQVGNVITNRNANRLEFERLLDGAKTYMRHHKVPSGMKRRVLRWYDYSWSRGRIQGGGDINTALGLLPDKLKTELALHVNLTVLKKVTIFQECQPEFLHDLVLKMKAYIFTPGDLICRKGEVAREMFIIADGILEVISETGHVLTTMKAGDFFGEIGILNLDGLNKRTADVRSVGYSELFSLSREDVLTAMKDYPEAQEILQTLGRKRLMEARNVTRAVLEQNRHTAMCSADTNRDHRSKNKIVDRLRSDVKGLRSVLRKSYKETKPEDSVELEPLTSISGRTEVSSALSGNRGTLYRVPNVWSEDMPQEDDQPQPSTSGERKISAGFPLLNKLKILTDKHQQQHQNAQLPQQEYCSSNERTDNDIEPIGAGLPLLQRLKLLKQKETADTLKNTLPVSKTVPTVRTQHLSNIKQMKNQKPTRKEVIFVDGTRSEKEPISKRISAVSQHSDSNSSQTNSEIKKPWLLLKRATISPFSNLNQNFSHKMHHKYFKNNKNIKIKNNNGCRTALLHNCEEDNNINKENFAQNDFKINNNNQLGSNTGTDNDSKNNCKNKNNNNDDSNSRHNKNNESNNLKSKLILPIPALKCPDSINTKSRRKTYASVADLSPEYFRLPFVKRLKILNERQKLAELEKKTLIRSNSLDSTNDCAHNFGDNLTRSLSETTIIDMMIQSQKKSNSASSLTMSIEASNYYDGDATSPNSCETSERKELKNILRNLSNGSCKIQDLLEGASSDETKNLTNFKDLRRLNIFKNLVTSQTIQGYIARHTTLEKSVRCYLNTLSSPPSSTLTPKNKFQFSVEEPSLDTQLHADYKNRITRNTTEHIRCTCDKNSSHSPSRNPDLIPDVDRSSEPNQSSPIDNRYSRADASSNTCHETCPHVFKTIHRRSITGVVQEDYDFQVLQMEQEVKKRDCIIEILQLKIIELELTTNKQIRTRSERSKTGVFGSNEPTPVSVRIRWQESEIHQAQKHHEHCFAERNKIEHRCYEPYDTHFMRDDSADTILLAPVPKRRSSCRELSNMEEIDNDVIEIARTRRTSRRSSNCLLPTFLRDQQVNIEIESDDSSSISMNETDELIDPTGCLLSVQNHNRDWEVMMLAQELEKREHEEQHQKQKCSDKEEKGAKKVVKMPLLNVRSLDEQRVAGQTHASSQRSSSTGNVNTNTASPIIITSNNEEQQESSRIGRPNADNSNASTSSQFQSTSSNSISPDVVPALLQSFNAHHSSSPSNNNL